MTALYLERYTNFGLTLEELQSGRPIVGIAQQGPISRPCKSPSPGPGNARAGGVSATQEAFRWNFRFTRSRKPASVPLRG